jgi:Ni/Co efflux regulator RcnB
MTAVAAALAMCMAGSALAQPHYGGPGPRDRRAPQQVNRRMPPPPPPQPRYDVRRDDGRAHAQWRRGDRLPPQYRNRTYVVNNYQQYRLQPPPRGYQWVGVGADFLLIAAATGLIAQIITGY